MMQGDRRLGWLVTAQLVPWLVSAVVASRTIRTPFGLPHVFIVPLFALTFSQITLLGLWAVFSPSRLRNRVLGSVAGTACLEAALDITLGEEFLLMPSVAMALTLLSFLGVRGFGVRLSPCAADVPTSSQEPQGFRFSIRGLMILTAVVALLSAVARGVRGSPGHFSLVLTVIWSVCFVAVSLLTLRACLGLDRPLRRGLPAIAVSPMLGGFFAYAAVAHRDGWVYILMTMLLYPAVLLGSLLVVRSCGYHLVRPTVSRPGPSGSTVGTPLDAVLAVSPSRDGAGK